METSLARKYSLYLLIVMGFLAFALRLGITARFQGLSAPPKYEAMPDQVEYEQLAFNLSLGKGYIKGSGEPTANRPIGTSLVLVPIYMLWGRSFTLGRLWFCFLSALTCLATAWVAWQCYGPRVSVVSAAWLTFYPGHFYYSTHFLSEVPFGLFVILACGLTLRSIKSRCSFWDFLAGLFWGLASLTRLQILIVIPIAWLMALRAPKIVRRQLFGHMGVQTCVLICVLAPWVIRNFLVMGKPTLSTQGAYAFWGAHNDTILNNPHLWGSWIATDKMIAVNHISGNEVEREAAVWKKAIEFVKDNYWAMPGLLVMKLWRLISPFMDTPNRVVFWAFAVGWLATCPFCVRGYALGLKDSRVDVGVLLAPILATVVTSVIFYGSERFRDSISPVFVIFAARSLVEIMSRAARRSTANYS
jgi:4-amino-4-deoxy-L-arabinose transferase-like glycosyltransferase